MCWMLIALVRRRQSEITIFPVATPAPNKPVPDDHHRHRHAAYAAEATGLLVMAVVLLLVILARYWANINWSLR